MTEPRTFTWTRTHNIKCRRCRQIFGHFRVMTPDDESTGAEIRCPVCRTIGGIGPKPMTRYERRDAWMRAYCERQETT